jgi:uncharacterized protein (TIGR02996 family)
MRRFEMSEGKSHKFWEIDLRGASFTVRYGRIGTDGRSSTKTFPTAEKAQSEAEKAIRSKTKKGYAEILADVAPASGIAPPNPELEALVIANYDGDEGWAVYADWLMAQGDARGEVIQNALSGNEQRAKSIQRVNEEQWLGDFWPIFMKLRQETRGWGGDNRLVELSWHRGFLKSARVGSAFDSDLDIPEMLTALFSAPAAGLLRTLKLGLPAHDGQADFGELIAWLGQMTPRPSITHVHLGDFEYPDETEISWTDVGRIDAMFQAFPNLTNLHVQGGSIEIGRLPSTLKRLTLETGGLPGGTFAGVCGSHLPHLEHMEIWFGSDDYGAGGTPDEITALLDGTHAPKLTWLGLKNGEIADGLLKLLVGSPLLKQIKTLDISMGTLTDAKAQILIDQAEHFAHLSRIDIGQNHLSNAFVNRVRRALPQAVSFGQKDGDDDWYYTSVGE